MLALPPELPRLPDSSENTHLFSLTISVNLQLNYFFFFALLCFAWACRRFLYPLEMPLREKISAICREIYGADGVDFSEAAERRIEVRPDKMR